GMFGKCHSAPVKEVYTYDVSPSVVQRFRMLLEKLSNRGLTWEDDDTQQVLSKELSKLRRIPYRPQQNSPVYNADSRSDVYPVCTFLALQCVPQTVPAAFTAGWSYFAVVSPHLDQVLVQLSDLLVSPPERFIENVLKNVGRQHVDVDNLTPQDLDQLSSLIADALQVVDQDQGRTRARGPGPRDLEGEPGEEDEEEEGEEEEKLASAPTLKSLESTAEALASGSLLTKLLAYLDKTPFTGPPPARNRYDVAMETPRGQPVGLENVQSRTSEAGVTVQKKDATQSVEEVSEVEGWIKEVPPPPASLVYDEPHKNTMHVPELQLDVKAGRKKADDDVFGYVITDTDHEDRNTNGNVLLYLLLCGPQGSQINQIPTKYSQAESTKFLILTVVSILCIVGVLLASTVVYCLRHRSHHKLKEKLTNLGTDTSGDATATYQELCRQRMAVKPPAERPEPISSRINSVSSQFSDGGPAISPSARSSISSWSEEPAHSNMDISTGHMILSYMEDHLKNKDRLEKEWEALCAYQAEPNACTVGLKDGNAKKNRSTAVVAYDHSRITLKVENSQGNSDYINASPIMDHDPRNPAYIATQGPLPSTVADFWQMVWENGCVVIVMLTPLVENGVKQCYHYWPDEGSNLYHIYEVNLVSEHIWCDDFLVRSFYLKNMQTNETRTVTQFHFLTWLNQNVPETSRTLLDFRRKVNKCYRGRSCPIIVHCSDGAGRSGTYVLVDMVLNKMAKGAKEIDIAATLEHLRDQRPGMVQTKDQFEFALTAVAEEVNAILKALPQ
uniref:Receptor-type tyrosine-protein phosphatase N2-like n=1 Tax=Stegastes partitus TaxID=144197 RepID=A0A3B5AE04_9TELE